MLEMVRAYLDENFWEVMGAIASFVFVIMSMMGVTIQSGWIGLRFTAGRAGRVLAPGFYPLIPFLQRVRRLPDRARTLNLECQRVTTLDGLVYDVDVSLVYRVRDIRKALIEVDHLENAMLQMCALAVQQTLCGLDAARLRVSAELDRALEARVAARLVDWGVQVERAGFSTITPSRESLRVTQLRRQVETRADSRALLVRDLSERHALGLVGARSGYRRRGHALRARETRHRAERALVAALLWRGHRREQLLHFAPHQGYNAPPRAAPPGTSGAMSTAAKPAAGAPSAAKSVRASAAR